MTGLNVSPAALELIDTISVSVSVSVVVPASPTESGSGYSF